MTNYGNPSSNGFLLSILSFAAKKYGWTLDYIKSDVSLLSLLLLMRQDIYENGNKGITLMDKEMIDSGEFDRKLKQNLNP